jgi:hypothetical protein
MILTPRKDAIGAQTVDRRLGLAKCPMERQQTSRRLIARNSITKLLPVLN